MNKLLFFLTNPRNIGIGLLNHFGAILNDVLYVKILYYLSMRKKLNLKEPKTYNEKLNWIKLYDHNPLYTTLVDKYSVKDWVKERIGSEYIIPTIGVWDKPEDIDWDSLPQQFVLKTTHGGGGDGVIVCKDIEMIDKEVVVKKLASAMKTDPYRRSREWPYKNVKRRIIAEEYMEDSETKELRDYKFFAFNGVVKAMFIASDRQKEGEDVKFDYFDENFNHLDLVQAHPMSGRTIAKPKTFDKMKELASILSKGFPEVRCDFYEVNGKVYFGELTFIHHGGITPFHPESWDYEWGKWIELPSTNLHS